MLRILRAQAFNRVVGLGLLTLMVLALVASTSAVSRSQDVSPPAAAAGPLPGNNDFRHEGE